MNRKLYSQTNKVWVLIVSGMILILSSCAKVTNYSAIPIAVNLPLILKISKEGTGHVITIRAQNEEIGFSGYRLFTGATAEEARTEATGTDCSWPLATDNNRAMGYLIEVKPGQTSVTPTTADNRLCAVPLLLNSGEWVTLRSLIYKNITTTETSEPSNAVQVP